MWYAQVGEDINLHKFFPDKQDGFYIDVGVWEPDIDSVTKHFYDQGWHGINIEPVPTHFAKVATARERDINLNVACGAEMETKKFYHVHDTGLGGFSEENARLPHNANRTVELIHVTVLPLKRICEMYIPQKLEIDFLKIDTEGWELEVLRGMDFTRFRPKIVLYEATVPGTSGKDAVMSDTTAACDKLLRDAHYVFLDFDGLNKWFRANEFQVSSSIMSSSH